MIERFMDWLEQVFSPLFAPDESILLAEAREQAVPEPETQEAKVQIGKQAARILEDPVFLLAVRRADDAFVSAWRNAGSPDAREDAWLRQNALEQVLHELRVMESDGIAEADIIERVKERSK